MTWGKVAQDRPRACDSDRPLLRQNGQQSGRAGGRGAGAEDIGFYLLRGWWQGAGRKSQAADPIPTTQTTRFLFQTRANLGASPSSS